MLLIMVGGTLVYSTGGLPNAYAHFFYAPILLASYYFALSGALVTAILCGVLVGPASGLDILPGPPQTTTSWLTRLGFFAGVGIFVNLLIASVLRNIDRAEASLREVYEAGGRTLVSFASLVALRDEQTAGHCERVAHNARVMGESLAMDARQLSELHWAGILHDLGKVATPIHILLKPGHLTDAEYTEVKKHAEIGGDMLANISPRFVNLAKAVRAHHERWDGTGYPRRAVGADIPLPGRILAIVDAFEAITSERPYRSPMPIEDALDVIRDGAGTHFDPELVDLFLDLYARDHIVVEADGATLISYEYPLPGWIEFTEARARA